MTECNYNEADAVRVANVLMNASPDISYKKARETARAVIEVMIEELGYSQASSSPPHASATSHEVKLEQAVSKVKEGVSEVASQAVKESLSYFERHSTRLREMLKEHENPKS